MQAIRESVFCIAYLIVTCFLGLLRAHAVRGIKKKEE